MSSSNEATFYIPVSKETAFRYICDLKRVGGMRIYHVDSDRYEVRLKVMINYFSLGEFIQVRFFADGKDATRVTARSESAMPTTLFDFGKNKRNLSEIQKALMAVVHYD